jgi:ribosomal protein S18 acetylase RimI-like enzyme
VFMGSPGKKWNNIFLNYLAFLNAHRATVTSMNDTVQVQSEKKEFTYLVPGEREPAPALLKNFNTLQLNPWSHRPEKGYAGFEEKDEVAYIRMAESISPPPVNPLFEIRLVKNKEDMRDFSIVQCLGLLGNSDVYVEWAPFLYKANESNLGAQDQFFYLGLLEGKPAAVAHSLDAEGVTGIYGIATLPDFRGKGLAHSILAKVSADAKERGSEALTLQVAKDSQGEAYFTKLGFAREFTAIIMERSKVSPTGE